MSLRTKEKLLSHGRALLWARGYSNVSLRQIATAADVDVALISRYFGGKLGLFEATLDLAFSSINLSQDTPQDLTDAMVALFVTAPRSGAEPSVLRMILTNAHDEDVGADVRSRTQASLYAPLLGVIKDPVRTTMFISVLLGVSVAEKTLQLPDVPAPDNPTYEALLRHLLGAALAFEQKT